MIEYQQISEPIFSRWAMNILDLFDLPKSARDLLIAKYSETDGFVEIPSKSSLATALLLDAKALLEQTA